MQPSETSNPPEDVRRPVRTKRKGGRRIIFLLVAAAIAALVYTNRNAILESPLATLVGEKLTALTGSKPPVKAGEVYMCPMHPDYHSDKPGTCPICGMTLVKMDAEDAAQDSPAAGEATGTKGTPALRIGAQKQQMIGVRYGEALLEPLSKTIRATAQLAYPETGLARVQAKVEGWIEKVHVDYVGKYVKKGQPLISLYSPQLVSTQQELIIAAKSRDQLGKSTYREIAAGALSLYDATRERLRFWDVSDAQIREIEKRGAPLKALAISSPISGFVVTRNAYPGQRITPETELYTLADFSTIWAIADVYEYELQMISVGQSADMTLSYYPGKTYHGKVTYISPELDKVARTAKVRLEFPNPDFQLKPDMFANVALKIDYGRHVSVPADAVLDSGLQQIVFVAREGGTFEPRRVQAGPRVGDRQIILKGLEGGERVVASGNFLIDSESQLKAGLNAMEGGRQTDEGNSSRMDDSLTAPPVPPALPVGEAAAGKPAATGKAQGRTGPPATKTMHPAGSK